MKVNFIPKVWYTSEVLVGQVVGTWLGVGKRYFGKATWRIIPGLVSG